MADFNVNMVKEQSSNIALRKSFKEGDKDAFEQLYHQHFNSLFEYGCRLSTDIELVRDARIAIRAEEEENPFQLVFSVESEYIRKETVNIQTRHLNYS